MTSPAIVPRAHDLVVQAPIELSLVTYLPAHRRKLRGPYVWPHASATPVARVSRVDVARLRDIAAVPNPDFVFAEAGNAADLLWLAERTAAGEFAALALVPEELPEEIAKEARETATQLRVVSGRGDLLVEAAGRATADLVRQRVYRLLLRAWNAEHRRREQALVQRVPGMVLPPRPPRPGVAPLDTARIRHAATVGGALWPDTTKAWMHLELKHRALRCARATVPPAVAAALQPLAAAPVRVLVVDRSPAVRQEVAQRLADSARAHGCTTEVVSIATPAEAREWLKQRPAPHLLWIDLRRPNRCEGLALAQRRRGDGGAPVVIARAEDATAEDMRALAEPGAVSVVTCDEALLSPRPEAQARAVAQNERLRRVLADALATAEELRLLDAAAAVVAGLEADLAPMPEGIGALDTPLGRIVEEAVELALAATDGNKAAAARLLQISENRLKRVQEGKPEPEEEEDG